MDDNSPRSRKSNPPCRQLVLLVDEEELTIIRETDRAESTVPVIVPISPDGTVSASDFDARVTTSLRGTKVLIVLSGSVYRSQNEFLPHTKASLARLALERRSECGNDEFLVMNRLGSTGTTKKRKDSWQVSVIRAPVLRSLTRLLELRLAARILVLTDEAIFQHMARRESRAAPNVDVLVVAIRQKTLNLAYMSEGGLLFGHRKALGDTSNHRVITSEIQRTTVFFHRRFQENRITKIVLFAEAPEGLATLAAAIGEACRIEDVAPAQIGTPSESRGAEKNQTQPLLLAWIRDLGWKHLPKDKSVEAPERRMARVRKRVTATIIVLILSLSTMATLYNLSLDGVIGEMRELVDSTRKELDRAERDIGLWMGARSRRAAVINEIHQLEKLAAEDFDLVATLNDIAEATPPGITVERFEIAHSQLREESGVGWEGVLILRCEQDYLHAEVPIKRTLRTFGEAPFLRGATLRLRIPPESYPWSGVDKKMSEGCRFEITFHGAKS